MPKIRIATLQLNSCFGHPAETLSKATDLIIKLQASPNYKPIDLLVLPEMIMTGYNFHSPQEVMPFLESLKNPGYILSWAKQISMTLGCYTVLGYAQSASMDEVRENEIKKSVLNRGALKFIKEKIAQMKKNEVEGLGNIYNSAVVFNKEGKVVHNYSKSFLYETDEEFGCREGPGFDTFTMPFETTKKRNSDGDIVKDQTENIRTSIGICMDLNPYKFQAPFTDFEFSSHCLRENVRLIIAPMAWLHGTSPSILSGTVPEPELEKMHKRIQEKFKEIEGKLIIDEPDRLTNATTTTVSNDLLHKDPLYAKQFQDLHEPDLNNLNYWLLRFLPFINYVNKDKLFTRKTTLVISNRVGMEDGVLFGGTSSIIQFNGKTPGDIVTGFDSVDMDNLSVDVLGALGKGNEGILIREVDV